LQLRATIMIIFQKIVKLIDVHQFNKLLVPGVSILASFLANLIVFKYIIITNLCQPLDFITNDFVIELHFELLDGPQRMCHFD
jgi:hypothetical protein